MCWCWGAQVVNRVRGDETAKQNAGTRNDTAALVLSDPTLDHRDDRSADDRHDEPGRTELGCRAEALQRDAVDGRKHQRETEGDGDDCRDAERVRGDDREEREPDRGDGGTAITFVARTRPINHVIKAPHEEDDETDLQEVGAELQRPVERLLDVLDDVCPGADPDRRC